MLFSGNWAHHRFCYHAGGQGWRLRRKRLHARNAAASPRKRGRYPLLNTRGRFAWELRFRNNLMVRPTTRSFLGISNGWYFIDIFFQCKHFILQSFSV